MREEGREGDHQGLIHTPCPKSWKYSDCRTDLIGSGGNTDTDLCSGWQTPSRRHWCCIVACKQTKDKHIFRERALKITLTRSIFQPKCTKYRLAAGLYPDPLGSLQRSPDPLLDLRDLLLRGEEERRDEGGDRRGREVEEHVGKGEYASLSFPGDGRPGVLFGFVIKHACDRQTHRQTDGQNCDSQDRASTAASRGKNCST